MNNSTIIIYILRVITGKIKLYFNIWKFRDNVLPLHSQNKVHWVFQHSCKGKPSTGFLEPNVTVKKWPTCIGICSFLFITVQNRPEKKKKGTGEEKCCAILHNRRRQKSPIPLCCLHGHGTEKLCRGLQHAQHRTGKVSAQNGSQKWDVSNSAHVSLAQLSDSPAVSKCWYLNKWSPTRSPPSRLTFCL